MTLNQTLYDALPQLPDALAASSLLTDSDHCWTICQRLMDSNSPTGSMYLPGTTIDVVASVVNEMGLTSYFYRDFQSTGNAALLLGDTSAPLTLVVDAHIDKPSFGVKHMRDSHHADLFACCANRFPQGDYHVKARIVRYDASVMAVQTCGHGTLYSQRGHGEDHLSLQLENGDLRPSDMVVLDVPATRDGEHVIGAGVDDAFGTAIVLGAAGIIQALQETLVQANVNCLFTFSDHEEWPPSSFFSLGASKTSFALPAPRVGAMVIDVHPAEDGDVIEIGNGLSCGVISAQGRGSVMPLNYAALTTQLIDDLNTATPRTAQYNTGYFSRSDDYAFTRWSKIVGLMGVPAKDIHRGNESGSLNDVQGGIRFAAHYIPLILGLVPAVVEQYFLLSPGRNLPFGPRR